MIQIDREQKLVRFRDMITGETDEQSYDIVVLSPGAKPMIPDIPGLHETMNLFTLRNIHDTDVIKAYVDERHPKHVTVIGAGFIGLEMAENLRERGLAVTIIDMGQQLLNPLDPEMAKWVEQHMRLNGVEMRLEEGVTAFEEQGTQLRLTSGGVLQTDMVILAIGVVPENELAKQSGLELGFRGAIQIKDRNHGFATMVSLAWGPIVRGVW